MEKKFPDQGDPTPNSAGLGLVTREMLREKAIALAVINGRAAREVAQAQRELAAEPDVDPKQAVLEAAPESERWDPVPGSVGHQAPESPREDEDEEGRNESTQLVEEGVQQAERDQVLRAADEKDQPAA